MRIIYIYQNRINNKIYVGQTNDFKRRKYNHEYDALKRKLKYPLYSSIRKYGINNFNILDLEIVEDQDADEVEQFYIQYFRSWDREYGYNIEYGGCDNKKLSQQTKDKISKIKKEIFQGHPELNPMFGKHHTQETKEKLSQANSGKCYNTLEHMQKIHKITSERLLGTYLSKETKSKISKANLGRKRTEETKIKMSQTRVENGTFAGENNPNFGKVGELNPSAILSWEIVNNIRLDYSLGLRGKSLMKKYNISETNMYRIIKNETWKIQKD